MKIDTTSQIIGCYIIYVIYVILATIQFVSNVLSL